MTTVAVRSARTRAVLIWGFAAVMWVRIWLDHKWPGSGAAVASHYAMDTCFAAWFGYRIWSGIQRRRPYWTRESWFRYLRLISMPLIALVLLFTELALFDRGPNHAVFGANDSLGRWLWILIDLSLMIFGIIGIWRSVDWLESGEPSAQFTRRRWLPYRWRNSQLTRED